jgi:transmembrane sensor
MPDESKHIKSSFDFSENPLEAHSKTHIEWGRSKEQIWAELNKKIETSEPAKMRVLISPWMKMAIAAAIALLVGISVILQSYTKTITIPAGQHSQIVLPDHSSVRLNAQSSLSYKPLLWKFSRKISFEGEAFFEVQKGKKFEVVSNNGITQVLGTSFNIYSRNANYEVTCISGKVRVTETAGKNEVIILHGQKASLNTQGILDVQTGINTGQTISWLENKLSFTSVPLKQVFEEIGRQYGIIILIPENLGNTYTGTFKRNTSVEQALKLVCKPFNLKFSRKSKDEFIITRNN